jgi:isopentenyl phosphate kinase
LRELVFVKLGGSIITDKLQAATPRLEVIERLAKEIRAAQSERPELRILLGHGSGSFGHVVSEKYRVHRGIATDQSWWGYAETGAAAARLNRIVTDTCLATGISVVSVQPSASARCRRGELVSMEVYPIRQALRRDLVPLVYGDVAFDDIQGCTIISTENVLAYLARALHPTRLVTVGKVDGVYDRDPLEHEAARHIPRITPDTFARIETRLGGSHGVDVTGGMLSKVREMVALVSQGHTQRVHLISGKREGALARVLIDAGTTIGTLIEAQSTP